MAHGAYHPHKTMESSSLFDLNEAIRRWRERLSGLRSFGADDLEELENHLRESIAELQAGILSQEEGFLVATERLGSDQRLADEYAKTNARRIWTGRAVWMLGGVMAAMVMKALIETGLGFVYHASLWLGLNVRLVVAVDFLTQWTITAARVGLCCWLLARRHRWLVGTVSKCFHRPVWTSVALVLAVLALQFLSHLPAHWWRQSFDPAARLSLADNSILRTWGFCAMMLTRLVWAAAIPLLAAYVWKGTRAVAASISSLPLDCLQPDERAVAGQLEARGLSRSESHLVIGWRRGYRATPADVKARAVSGPWLEGGFWMMVGMVANGILKEFVDTPSWMLKHSDSLPPVWQHFGGLVAMCLPLTLVGAAIAVFWKSATGSHKQNIWMRRVFQQSPARGAGLFAALALLWAGVTAYFFLAQPADAPSPILARSQIEIIWWVCRAILTEFLLPVILLAWVGNRYQAGSKTV